MPNQDASNYRKDAESQLFGGNGGPVATEKETVWGCAWKIQWGFPGVQRTGLQDRSKMFPSETKERKSKTGPRPGQRSRALPNTPRQPTMWVTPARK